MKPIVQEYLKFKGYNTNQDIQFSFECFVKMLEDFSGFCGREFEPGDPVEVSADNENWYSSHHHNTIDSQHYYVGQTKDGHYVTEHNCAKEGGMSLRPFPYCRKIIKPEDVAKNEATVFFEWCHRTIPRKGHPAIKRVVPLLKFDAYNVFNINGIPIVIDNKSEFTLAEVFDIWKNKKW